MATTLLRSSASALAGAVLDAARTALDPSLRRALELVCHVCKLFVIKWVRPPILSSLLTELGCTLLSSQRSQEHPPRTASRHMSVDSLRDALQGRPSPRLPRGEWFGARGNADSDPHRQRPRLLVPPRHAGRPRLRGGVHVWGGRLHGPFSAVPRMCRLSVSGSRGSR